MGVFHLQQQEQAKAQAVFATHGLPHIRTDERLAPYTTWRIGGCADYYVAPTSVAELASAVRAASELQLPITVIGRGSNVLVLDGGVRGLVVHMHDKFAQILVEGSSLEAYAGRSIVSAANIAISNGLAGLEFATGIPGSVGGAVMMNAGAHGGQIADVFEYADVLRRDGELIRLSPADMRFAYRYSILKDDPLILVKASFQLRSGNRDELTAQIRAWSKHRLATQPLSQPNCGSVFRNPPGMHAGHLVESAGLKGFRHGDAQISEKHANFIVNLGHASAEDVRYVIMHAQETIQERYGVELETEVRVIGEPASRR